MTQPPSDMIPELSAWNNGAGVNLKTWVACEGNFRLAVGYSAVFWPEFVLFEDYILREGFTEQSVRAFEKQPKATKQSVEWVVNHLHISDIQHCGCEDISTERIVFLGRRLKEMWEAKLAWQFPDRPCQVEFYEPQDRTNLTDFQVTFWQKKHETSK